MVKKLDEAFKELARLELIRDQIKPVKKSDSNEEAV